MNKLGRPKSKKSKDVQVNFRLTREEMARLENASKKYGKSKSEVIRKGINQQYEEAMKEKKWTN